jgi:hypothetical protein
MGFPHIPCQQAALSVTCKAAGNLQHGASKHLLAEVFALKGHVHHACSSAPIKSVPQQTS